MIRSERLAWLVGARQSVVERAARCRNRTNALSMEGVT